MDDTTVNYQEHKTNEDDVGVDVSKKEASRALHTSSTIRVGADAARFSC